jgi:hypothetical protein
MAGSVERESHTRSRMPSAQAGARDVTRVRFVCTPRDRVLGRSAATVLTLINRVLDLAKVEHVTSMA